MLSIRLPALRLQIFWQSSGLQYGFGLESGGGDLGWDPAVPDSDLNLDPDPGLDPDKVRICIPIRTWIWAQI